MASKVNVPLLGPTNKGTVIGVGIGGVTLAGYMIIRRQRKNAALAAQAAQAQAQSGYGYGAGAYLDNSGYYGYGGQMTYGYGASGGFPATGYYGYGTPIPPASPITTDAQWAQAAINQLSSEGYDPMAVSGALGNYLTGQPLDATQQGIVRAAIAIEGYPPQPPSGGIIPQGTPGGGGGGGQGGGGQVTVPNVVGKGLGAAKATILAAGLKYKFASNPFKPGLVVTAESPPAGTQVARGSTVTLSVGRIPPGPPVRTP